MFWVVNRRLLGCSGWLLGCSDAYIWQAPLISMTDNNNVALPYMASTINKYDG